MELHEILRISVWNLHDASMILHTALTISKDHCMIFMCIGDVSTFIAFFSMKKAN